VFRLDDRFEGVEIKRFKK